MLAGMLEEELRTAGHDGAAARAGGAAARADRREHAGGAHRDGVPQQSRAGAAGRRPRRTSRSWRRRSTTPSSVPRATSKDSARHEHDEAVSPDRRWRAAARRCWRGASRARSNVLRDAARRRRRRRRATPGAGRRRAPASRPRSITRTLMARRSCPSGARCRWRKARCRRGAKSSRRSWSRRPRRYVSVDSGGHDAARVLRDRARRCVRRSQSARPRRKHPGGSFTELLTVYAIVNAVTANLPDHPARADSD